ncbi:MAG: MFS transporter [Clostridiales bacterium]|nr:MFS transporter [Clostridiales bacterium]
MVVGLFIIAPSTIVGEMSQQLGVSVAAVSAAVLGTYSFASAIGCIISGPIIDKFGVPKSITVGAILIFLPCLLFSTAFGSTITGVLVLRVIMGLASGPAVACVSTVAVKWFPPKERPIYSGFQGCGISAGIMIGLIIVPQLMKVCGGDFKKVFAWLGIMPLIALISSVVTLFVKEPLIAIGHGHSNDFIKAIKTPAFYFVMLAIFIGIWVMDAFNDLTPGYMAIPAPMGLGFGGQAAGIAMTFVSIGSIVGALLSGVIVLYLFKGKVKPSVVIGFLGCAIFVLSVRFPFIYGNPPVLYSCLFLQGFFISLVVPQTALFVAQSFPVNIVGKVYGTAMGIGAFGSVGISFGAFLLHATGNYHASIYAVSIIAIIGCVIGINMNVPKERQIEQKEPQSLAS